MRNATFRFLALVVAVFLVGGAVPVQAQGTFAHGTVVALQGTPHLWFADEHGVLHWGGDTRALAGKHIAWSNRVEVSLDQLRTLPVGDPWLSAGLLKDGDPIYLVKWETDWPQPQLLHIQSITDVELFGINGSNYGKFVIDRPAWEARYGISAADLQRGVLASAVPTPTAVSAQQLIGDYAANELAADLKYKGKWVVISGGTVDEVRSFNRYGAGEYGTSVEQNALRLERRSGDYTSPRLYCFFDKDKIGQFATVKKGDAVTLEGRVHGLDDTFHDDLYLEHCEVRT